MTDESQPTDTHDTIPLPTPSRPAPVPDPARTPTAAETWPRAATTATAHPPMPAGPPPVRWGGVVWGLLLVAFAATTLAIVSLPTRLVGVAVWITSLTPGAAWALWIAALGVVIVISALLGVTRATRRNRLRRS